MFTPTHPAYPRPADVAFVNWRKVIWRDCLTQLQQAELLKPSPDRQEIKDGNPRLVYRYAVALAQRYDDEACKAWIRVNLNEPSGLISRVRKLVDVWYFIGWAETQLYDAEAHLKY